MTTLGADDPLGADLIATIREVTAATPRAAQSTGFSFVRGNPIEFFLAPLIGLYLGYAVVRLPEVFEALAIQHLPMILMIVFIAIMGFTVPADAWGTIWRRSKPFRLVIAIFALALITAPLGIWPSESFLFIREHYVVDVVIFIMSMIFLRDRRNFRVTAMVFVLCSTAVSYHVIKTYDPNATVYSDDGDPIDPAELAARPELRRLQSVGISLDPNDFGAILATSFPLALWLSVGSVRRRIFWTAMAGIMVAAVVPTQSRGSELGFLAVATVILTIGARGWRRWMSLVLIVGAIAMFGMMATGIGAGGRFTDFGSDDYNVTGNQGRLYFWKQGLIWMAKRPWGYGIENFSTYFGMLNGEERAAHSSWIQYAMELGVAGITLFVMLVGSLIRGLRQLRKRAVLLREQHPAAKNEEVLTGHMLAVMAGVLVTGSFLSNAYYPLMYMALGMAAATLLGSPLNDVEVTEIPTAAPVLTPGEKRRLRAFPAAAP
ncbi:MAG TPA: O-antigen ligase family protein [Gemmatimonadales bacterium]|jgi:hypothetical protein